MNILLNILLLFILVTVFFVVFPVFILLVKYVGLAALTVFFLMCLWQLIRAACSIVE